MPGDLTVPSVSQTHGPPAAVGSPAPAPAPTVGASAAPAHGGGAPSLHVNPVSQLDPALGLVVLHFYNALGDQTSTIPTQKQLDLYRLHDDSGSTPDAAATNRPAASPDAGTADGA